MIDVDARDFAGRVALLIGIFFDVRWTRTRGSAAEAEVRFECADPGTVSATLTTRRDGSFVLTADGGFVLRSRSRPKSLDEGVDEARRALFDIGHDGLVAVLARTRRGHEQAVGPAKSARMRALLDDPDSEMVDVWWRWPPARRGT